jgi:hypothetical protein
MVQSTHQILDGISGDKRQTIGGTLDTADVINQSSRCRVALGSNFIGSGVKESLDFPIQVCDVLFGPFDF